MRGERPRRWVLQTDFGNDEAVGYLADRLARLGVEEALAEAGARPGDPVDVGGVVFDWHPGRGVVVDEEFEGGRRGSDERVSPSTRTRAHERKAARRERRGLDDDEPEVGDGT